MFETSVRYYNIIDIEFCQGKIEHIFEVFFLRYHFNNFNNFNKVSYNQTYIPKICLIIFISYDIIV